MMTQTIEKRRVAVKKRDRINVSAVAPYAYASLAKVVVIPKQMTDKSVTLTPQIVMLFSLFL